MFEVIKSTSEFKKIFQKNQKFDGKLFVLLVGTEPASLLTIGLVVSKKVGNAVTRNKVKRLIRAFFWDNRELCHFNKKIVIIARKACANASWGSINADFKHLFDKMVF